MNNILKLLIAIVLMFVSSWGGKNLNALEFTSIYFSAVLTYVTLREF